MDGEHRCALCGHPMPAGEEVFHYHGYSGGCPVPVVQKPPAPKVVCLCGSTRFYEAFQRANYDETMAGNIVLSVGFYSHSSEQAHGEHIGISDAQKNALDELHKRKIDLANEILVLNVGGYIGASTRSEIAYAESLGKVIRYSETN